MGKETMIPGYDHNIKLYSKCARDLAARNSRQKTSTSTLKPNKSSIITCQEGNKQRKVVPTFNMSESREQREKKYQVTSTPAVGQYHAQPPPTPPKLTWDILKAYQKRGCSKRKTKHELEEEQEREENRIKDYEQNQNLSESLEKNLVDFSVSLSAAKPKGRNEGESKAKYNRLKMKTEKVQRDPNTNRRYHTIKSQVNMDRMTGRKQSHFQVYSHQSSLNIDMSRSIESVKCKTSQKISFQNQISRERANDLLGKAPIVPSDYSYDYNKLKPRKTAYINFKKFIGRKNTVQSSNADSAASYTHYDYDKYVWGGKSNIFTNTKTHAIDFTKQTERKTLK